MAFPNFQFLSDPRARAIGKYAVIISLSVVFVIVALILLVSVWSQSKPRQVSAVDAEWSQNIRQLGIEPVYPPQEDIAVGDLYAVAVEGNPTKDAPVLPLPGHSVKLMHLDMTPELEENYKGLYLFPDTEPRPANATDIWKQHAATASIFNGAQPRTYLPLVLFPGVTIARTREATGGIGGALSHIGVFLGASRQENENIDLRIPVAESYGVGSIPASRRLARFCLDEATKRFCTDEAVRNQLSMVIGERVFERSSNTYRHQIELVLISRVYMTRSIESVTSSDSSSVAQTGVSKQAAQLADEAQKLNAAVAAVKAEAAANNVGEQTKQALAEQQARLQEVVKSLSGNAPAALASTRSAEGHRIVAAQTFQRPVVIGYRAARYALEK